MATRGFGLCAAAAVALSVAAAGAPPIHAPVLAPSRAVGGTHNCSDYYPDMSRRLDESGDVLVSYDVSADGSLSNIKVVRSSGFARLDLAAVLCVSQRWRNTPALRDGVPVASPDHRAIIRFKLRGTEFDYPTLWLLLALGIGALAAMGWMVAGIRRWVFRARTCPACKARNRSILPFAAPGYCSTCGTKFARQA